MPLVNTHHIVGHGPHRVIGLHSWFGDCHSFVPIESSLTGSDFTYAFMDCRGYGGMRSARGAYTIDEIAADALTLADARGFGDFSLVGHAMGAKACERVLALAPRRVRKIVAVAPVPASGVPLDARAWALFSGAAENPASRYAIIDYTTGNRLSKAWIERMVAYSLSHSTREAFAAYLPAWSQTDFSADVKGKAQPLKAIVGINDAVITAELVKSTYLSWYPNAELEVMPNAGHYPMEETPVALATSIEKFLRD